MRQEKMPQETLRWLVPQQCLPAEVAMTLEMNETANRAVSGRRLCEEPNAAERLSGLVQQFNPPLGIGF